ncbi:unnamed protein product, partial [Callosobruchus maculatus]
MGLYNIKNITLLSLTDSTTDIHLTLFNEQHNDRNVCVCVCAGVCV